MMLKNLATAPSSLLDDSSTLEGVICTGTFITLIVKGCLMTAVEEL